MLLFCLTCDMCAHILTFLVLLYCAETALTHGEKTHLLFLLTCEATHTRKPFLSKTPSFARSHCIFILWLLSQPVENVKSKVTSGFNDLPPLQYQTLWYASLRSRARTWSYVFYRVGYSRPSYQWFLTSAMLVLRRKQRKQRTFLKGTPSLLSLLSGFSLRANFRRIVSDLRPQRQDGFQVIWFLPLSMWYCSTLLKKLNPTHIVAMELIFIKKNY